VAFRTRSGRVAVLGASCSHQGADLGRGRVVGETIQCPYHHWRYDTEGLCVGIPGTSLVPGFACQTAFPTVERLGYVFFFNGVAPLFPLPFFIEERPEEFLADRSFSFVADCPWWMLVANGFDMQHFHAVHDRTVIGAERVDSPAPFARRVQFDALITGHSVYDRALRAFLGRRVEIAITCWGGPFVTVTGTFPRVRSYIMIAAQPTENGQTLTEVIVCAPRRPWPALKPVSLRMRRLFTKGFMRDDPERLTGVRYNPHTFIETDRVVVEFLQWLAALPQTAGDTR
jgi:phenylpropionate dioxygenase-like ring-hydroxylating dioxygenase large terminal subunit